ncbi:unnamed protein product [Ixodes persulcatus]
MSSRRRTGTSATMRDASALTYRYVSDHERVKCVDLAVCVAVRAVLPRRDSETSSRIQS